MGLKGFCNIVIPLREKRYYKMSSVRFKRRYGDGDKSPFSSPLSLRLPLYLTSLNSFYYRRNVRMNEYILEKIDN